MKPDVLRNNGELRRRLIVGTVLTVTALATLVACDFHINGVLIANGSPTPRPTYTITVTPYGYNPDASATPTFISNRDVADTSIPQTQQAQATFNAELTPQAP